MSIELRGVITPLTTENLSTPIAGPLRLYYMSHMPEGRQIPNEELWDIHVTAHNPIEAVQLWIKTFNDEPPEGKVGAEDTVEVYQLSLPGDTVGVYDHGSAGADNTKQLVATFWIAFGVIDYLVMPEEYHQPTT